MSACALRECVGRPWKLKPSINARAAAAGGTPESSQPLVGRSEQASAASKQARARAARKQARARAASPGESC